MHRITNAICIRFCMVLCALAACCALWSGCATTGAVYSYEEKLLDEADSLFRAGNYEYAKLKYTKIRDDYPKSKPGSYAH